MTSSTAHESDESRDWHTVSFLSDLANIRSFRPLQYQMHLNTFILFVSGVAASFRDEVVHEKRNQLASLREWSEEHIEDKDHTIRATIALKQSNLDRAYEYVLDV